jgi:hypothetical protein
MRERIALGSAMLIAGAICVAVTLIAAAWLDAVSMHERSAEIQAMVQLDRQGKEAIKVPPPALVLSSLMLWSTFVLGGYLLVAGFVMGVRSRAQVASA